MITYDVTTAPGRVRWLSGTTTAGATDAEINAALAACANDEGAAARWILLGMAADAAATATDDHTSLDARMIPYAMIAAAKALQMDPSTPTATAPPAGPTLPEPW